MQIKICGGTNLMKTILLTALIGVIAGVIDVLPMLKMKLDRFSVASAFVFYLIMPFIIFNTNLFGMVWWLKGAVITAALAAPVIILVAKEEKKSILPMILTSAVLGTLIGAAGHFFLV